MNVGQIAAAATHVPVRRSVKVVAMLVFVVIEEEEEELTDTDLSSLQY